MAEIRDYEKKKYKNATRTAPVALVKMMAN